MGYHEPQPGTSNGISTPEPGSPVMGYVIPEEDDTVVEGGDGMEEVDMNEPSPPTTSSPFPPSQSSSPPPTTPSRATIPPPLPHSTPPPPTFHRPTSPLPPSSPRFITPLSPPLTSPVPGSPLRASTSYPFQLGRRGSAASVGEERETEEGVEEIEDDPGMGAFESIPLEEEDQPNGVMSRSGSISSSLARASISSTSNGGALKPDQSDTKSKRSSWAYGSKPPSVPTEDVKPRRGPFAFLRRKSSKKNDPPTSPGQESQTTRRSASTEGSEVVRDQFGDRVRRDSGGQRSAAGGTVSLGIEAEQGDDEEKTPVPHPRQEPRIAAPPAIPHEQNPVVAAAMARENGGMGHVAAIEGGGGRPSSPIVKGVKMESVERVATPPPPPDRSASAAGSEKRISESSAGPHAAVGVTVAGPSMFEQVRSQTRPVHLPPKSREEDEAHLKAWEGMMEDAKQAEKRHQAQQAVRRLEREKRLAESTPVWESIIASYQDGRNRDWRAGVMGDPKLRKVWFEGCPSHLRGRVWSMCIGNGLALPKESYKMYHSRANRAVESNRFPPDILKLIDDDSAEVFPTLKLFQRGTPMQEELRDLLRAWYVSRVDEGLGYTKGIQLLAAMLLMTMNLSLAFICMRNLLERGVLRAFYCGLTDEVEAYYRILDNLAGDIFPKVYANCKALGIRMPSSYFTTLFLQQLSFETSCRVWDQILLDGDSQIFRVALAILGILEPRLYYPDRNEINSIFEGKNAATLAIVAREKERAKQKGLPFDLHAEDGALTALGVDERTVFDRIADDGWKESRYERLVQRELPD